MTEALLIPAVTSMTGQEGAKFLHMIEVYVDDLVQLAQTDNEEVLQQCSQALLNGIYSVFPSQAITRHVGEEPVSMKN